MKQEVDSQPRTALVLYGSETGNAEEIAKEVDKILQRQRFATRFAVLDEIDPRELTTCSVCVFVISTTGQGDLPANARSFWRKIRSTRLQPGCLEQLQLASFGLGDSSYLKFNWAHRKLSNRLKQLGGNYICDRGEGDEQHPEGIDATFMPWSLTFINALLTLYPLHGDLAPIPDDVFLTPKWALVLDQGPCTTANAYKASPSKDTKTWFAQSHMEITTSNNVTEKSAAPDAPARNSVGTLLKATLKKNARITPEKHWQDVRIFEFATAPVQYAAGDVLSIHPKNEADDVDQFIKLMGWEESAQCTVHFVPTQTPSPTLSDPPVLLEKSRARPSLREFMTDHIDLSAIPKRSFFASISHFTEDEMQKERLVDFTNPDLVDELFDYTTRPRRSVLEVLQEFDTVKIPLEWVASVMPLVRPRQFSIASGGELKVDALGNGRIELLVAIVKYRTVIKKIRRGLCTSYMSSLLPGTQLDVQLIKGGMKLFPGRPAIFIGPGTGVAPLRSMIYERMHLADSPQSNPGQLLFFGGRNREADYFFKEEWNIVRSKTPLEVLLAFSRDQKHKIYVQDLIRQHSHLVYSVLLEGVVYVCGSSGKMPQAVREAIIEVFEKHGQMDRLEAEKSLEQMEKTGRYQQETW